MIHEQTCNVFPNVLKLEINLSMLFKFIGFRWKVRKAFLLSETTTPFYFIVLADSKPNFTLSEIAMKLCSKKNIELVLWKGSIPFHIFLRRGCDLDLKVSLH